MDEANPFSVELSKRIRSLKKKIGKIENKIENLNSEELDELDKDQRTLILSKPTLEGSLHELIGLKEKFDALEGDFIVVNSEGANTATAKKEVLEAKNGIEVGEAENGKEVEIDETKIEKEANTVQIKVLVDGSGDQDVKFASVTLDEDARVKDLQAAVASSPHEPVGIQNGNRISNDIEALCDLIFVCKFFPSSRETLPSSGLTEMPEALRYLGSLVLGSGVYPGMTFADALSQSKHEAKRYLEGRESGHLGSVTSDLVSALGDLTLESLDDQENKNKGASAPSPPLSVPPPQSVATMPSPLVGNSASELDRPSGRKREKRQTKKASASGDAASNAPAPRDQDSSLPPSVASTLLSSAESLPVSLSFGFFGNEEGNTSTGIQNHDADMNDFISFGSLHESEDNGTETGSSCTTYQHSASASIPSFPPSLPRQTGSTSVDMSPSDTSMWTPTNATNVETTSGKTVAASHEGWGQKSPSSATQQREMQQPPGFESQLPSLSGSSPQQTDESDYEKTSSPQSTAALGPPGKRTDGAGLMSSKRKRGRGGRGGKPPAAAAVAHPEQQAGNLNPIAVEGPCNDNEAPQIGVKLSEHKPSVPSNVDPATSQNNPSKAPTSRKGGKGKKAASRDTQKVSNSAQVSNLGNVAGGKGAPKSSLRSAGLDMKRDQRFSHKVDGELNGNRKGSKDGKNNSASRCHLCGEEGHLKALCPHASAKDKPGADEAVSSNSFPKHQTRPGTTRKKNGASVSGSGSCGGKSKAAGGSGRNDVPSAKTGWDAPVTSVDIS